MQPLFRILEHPADLGFEVEGETAVALYAAAANALFHLMWDAFPRSGDESLVIAVQGGDQVELLVNFLEEFIYYHDARKMVFTGIVIDSLASGSLRATARWRIFDPEYDRKLRDVKAVTYHQIAIEQDAGGRYLARVFVDI